MQIIQYKWAMIYYLSIKMSILYVITKIGRLASQLISVTHIHLDHIDQVIIYSYLGDLANTFPPGIFLDPKINKNDKLFKTKGQASMDP